MTTDDRDHEAAADSRAATADARESTADSRVATVESRAATAKSKASGRRSDRSAITVILASMALLVAGGFGLYNQNQVNATQRCISAYVSGAAPYAQALADAQQMLWDDFKASQTATTPKSQARLKTKFFADLDSEKKANDALKAYRAAHLPSKVCPS